MPPKGKKTKAEEALDFLSNLDNLDAPPTSAATSTEPPSTSSQDPPRPSTDSGRPKSVKSTTDLSSSQDLGRATPAKDAATVEENEEAHKALAFLEAQINTKRAPLSAPKPSAPRASTPLTGNTSASQGGATSSTTATAGSPPNEPTSAAAAAAGGWGSSWWSTATSAIQNAQKMADEGYKKVRSEGVAGVSEQLKGVDLNQLRKGAEERFGGMVKNVDLEKLRESDAYTLRVRLISRVGGDLIKHTSSTLTSILNTVAPPISAHETLELWLSHPMSGYSGVEGVVYRAWMKILEQTESGELIVMWSPEDEKQDDKERGINPVEGFEEGWKRQNAEVVKIREREEANPQGRARVNRKYPTPLSEVV